jgi:hypothetical protein
VSARTALPEPGTGPCYPVIIFLSTAKLKFSRVRAHLGELAEEGANFAVQPLSCERVFTKCEGQAIARKLTLWALLILQK